MIRAVPILCVLLLLSPVSIADDDSGTKIEIDEKAWKALDLEAKWHLYRTRKTTDSPKAWHAFLAAEGEFELLEWCAIYEGWPGPGDVLVSNRAPQWMRAAIWALASQDSHSFESAATNALAAHPEITLGYVAKHPELENDRWLEDTLKRIREGQTKPGDPGGLLPPLTPDGVYAALYASRETLPGAETGPLFDNRVIRAIEGLALSNRRPAKALEALHRLALDDDDDIQLAACLAYNKLPEWMTPRATMLRIASDPATAAKIRETAMMAFGRSNHPAVFSHLVEVMTDVTHPAWRAAVVRVVDKGDAFVLRPLNGLVADALGTPNAGFLQTEAERLRETLFARDQRQRASLVPSMLERGAWLALSASPLAADYARYLNEAVNPKEGWTANSLRKLAREYSAPDALFDERVWREPDRPAPTKKAVTELVRNTASELLR